VVLVVLAVVVVLVVVLLLLVLLVLVLLVVLLLVVLVVLRVAVRGCSRRILVASRSLILRRRRRSVAVGSGGARGHTRGLGVPARPRVWRRCGEHGRDEGLGRLSMTARW
jgi:hypothetical protein